MCALPGLLATPAADAWDNCSKRQLRAQSTQTIDLDAYARVVREQPAFYYHDTERDYVFFMSPADVVAWLEAQGKQTLLQLLKRDLPLKEDTDLFKYSLRTREASPLDIHWLIAGLLDAGHVMVDRLPLRGTTPDSAEFYDRQDPLRIKRVLWQSRGSDGRRYCQESGLEILTIVETIYD